MFLHWYTTSHRHYTHPFFALISHITARPYLPAWITLGIGTLQRWIITFSRCCQSWRHCECLLLWWVSVLSISNSLSLSLSLSLAVCMYVCMCCFALIFVDGAVAKSAFHLSTASLISFWILNKSHIHRHAPPEFLQLTCFWGLQVWRIYRRLQNRVCQKGFESIKYAYAYEVGWQVAVWVYLWLCDLFFCWIVDRFIRWPVICRQLVRLFADQFIPTVAVNVLFTAAIRSSRVWRMIQKLPSLSPENRWFSVHVTHD